MTTQNHIFRKVLGLYNLSFQFQSKASIIVATASRNTNTVHVALSSISEAALTFLGSDQSLANRYCQTC